jgi:hypothetical protein
MTVERRGGVMDEPARARRLTDQEGRRLQQIVRRGRHESIRVRRAMIIMASASGTLVPGVGCYRVDGTPATAGSRRRPMKLVSQLVDPHVVSISPVDGYS